MRFMLVASPGSRVSSTNQTLVARGSGLRARDSIKLPFRSERPFFRIEILFPHRFRLLFSGLEHALLVASDALVRVQALENEFGGRYLPLGGFLLRHAQRPKLVNQTLNSSQ